MLIKDIKFCNVLKSTSDYHHSPGVYTDILYIIMLFSIITITTGAFGVIRVNSIIRLYSSCKILAVQKFFFSDKQAKKICVALYGFESWEVIFTPR